MKNVFKDNKKRVTYDVDISVMSYLNAGLVTSEMDAYLQHQLRGLLRYASPGNQRKLADVMLEYIYRLRRKSFGEAYIDHNLNWIFNRHECIKATRAGARMEITPSPFPPRGEGVNRGGRQIHLLIIKAITH